MIIQVEASYSINCGSNPTITSPPATLCYLNDRGPYYVRQNPKSVNALSRNHVDLLTLFYNQSCVSAITNPPCLYAYATSARGTAVPSVLARHVPYASSIPWAKSNVTDAAVD